MQFDFSDQTAIVTGGTRGIGRSVSEAFLKAGAKIVATYKSNHDAAESFCEENSQYASQIQVAPFDVSDSEGGEGFYKLMEEKNGPFQILVNNSGIRKDSVVGMMKEEDWRDVIDANLTGTFLMSKFAIKKMLKNKKGKIINITSVVGHTGNLGQANYTASKAGLVAMSKSLAIEYAKKIST